MEKKSPIKKIINIVSGVILVFFIVLAVFSLILTITAKNNNGAATIFGTQIRYVLTESMEECEKCKEGEKCEECKEIDISKCDIGSISKDSMIFIETVPEDTAEAAKWYDALKVGDVLTFTYDYGGTQQVITHRIVDKITKPGGYEIHLRGDNKNSKSDPGIQIIDTSTPPGEATKYVIGKVTGQCYVFGWFISLLKKPIGLVLIIIVPALIIIGYEMIKIVNLLSKEKRKKANEKIAEQNDEIEELRKKLAELQGSDKSSE